MGMRRRDFIAAVVGSAASWPLAARAQQVSRTYRIGYLTGGSEAVRRPFLAAFRAAMRDLGYVEGTSFSIVTRYAEGKFDRLSELARELLSLDPDVLLVSTTPANIAAKRVTSSTPIVMVAVADPIGVGLVESLARPGGNITGFTNIDAELAGKRLEILRELVPGASQIAVLINPGDPNAPFQMHDAEAAARTLGVRLDPILHIRQASDLKGAFESAVRARAGAALRMVDPTLTALAVQTAALAHEHRLPVMYPLRGTVDVGGLVSYGASLPDSYRKAAEYVHRIVNGAKPADLPVQQPTKFELVINLKAARAIGLAVPPALVARADEVIE
jgi:putative ABC transport system substrate-binding protein